MLFYEVSTENCTCSAGDSTLGLLQHDVAAASHQQQRMVSKRACLLMGSAWCVVQSSTLMLKTRFSVMVTALLLMNTSIKKLFLLTLSKTSSTYFGIGIGIEIIRTVLPDSTPGLQHTMPVYRVSRHICMPNAGCRCA